MQHLRQNQNTIAGARQSVHPDKHATVSSPRRHIALKKKEGCAWVRVCMCVCACVCVKGAGEEKKIVSWRKGGRKFTSGSSTVGHLEEQREEHKAGMKALLMKTLMRVTMTATLSSLLILYIYIFFLIVKREENVKYSLIRYSQNLPLPKASKSLPVSVSIHHATLG